MTLQELLIFHSIKLDFWITTFRNLKGNFLLSFLFFPVLCLSTLILRGSFPFPFSSSSSFYPLRPLHFSLCFSLYPTHLEKLPNTFPLLLTSFPVCCSFPPFLLSPSKFYFNEIVVATLLHIASVLLLLSCLTALLQLSAMSHGPVYIRVDLSCMISNFPFFSLVPPSL